MVAPAAFTADAISSVGSSPSMEQGPAMMAIFSCPPILTPPQSTTVSSGWNRRLTFLYGAETRVMVSTNGLTAICVSSTMVVSPTRPNTL